MSSREYAKAIIDDFVDAGILTSNNSEDGELFTDRQPSFDDLLELTEFIGHSFGHPRTHFAARTPLGAAVVSAHTQAKQKFIFVSNYTVCSEAEPKLYAGLLDAHIIKPNKKSPIVLTEEAGGMRHPVGIVKNIGETTIYGLEDRPQLNLLEGAFSAAPTWVDDIMHGHTMPLSAAIEALPPVELLRFSSYLIPVDHISIAS